MNGSKSQRLRAIRGWGLGAIFPQFGYFIAVLHCFFPYASWTLADGVRNLSEPRTRGIRARSCRWRNPTRMRCSELYCIKGTLHTIAFLEFVCERLLESEEIDSETFGKESAKMSTYSCKKRTQLLEKSKQLNGSPPSSEKLNDKLLVHNFYAFLTIVIVTIFFSFNN